MAKIQASLIHVSKPVPRKIAKMMEKRKEELRKKEAEMIMKEINDFETILTKLEPIGAEKERERPSSTVHIQEVPLKEAFVPCVRVEEDHTFIENLRKRLDEEGKARKEREKRRRRVLLDQLQAHEAQEEVYREEQLVNRLMRQSLQERRIAVQLMLARHEKQVITQNRIFREKQYEEKRLQEFQEVLDKEAVLVRQEKLEHMEHIQREREVHERVMAQRAEQRFRKHYSLCQEVVDHIIDLVIKIAEYRELTLKYVETLSSWHFGGAHLTLTLPLNKNLRERLWDISDTRKEEAERERMNIMGNGWLEDHLGLLLNIYTTLMQVEIDRLQDTYRFLQDYYKVMEGTIPPEDNKEFARIPLVSVPDVQIPATVPAMDQDPVRYNGTVTMWRWRQW
ncbi:sperm flagellar protein 2-like [Chiloscyllium plagiosum]|uniref:sperm flagellar protein 2-like n=1 Tax=Chiloscyllium plagiosum TaxID=36176 RepID=UPI001CB7BC73|nr:sperm flagellar protein 2-like [Chiloscyllium plagiosum]